MALSRNPPLAIHPPSFIARAPSVEKAAHYQQQDWEQTVRMRTTYSGGVEGTSSSLPFGDGFSVLSGADTDGHHFAGLDDTFVSGLAVARYREYSSSVGSWMSPDPYDGSYDFTNPQSFNRYAYVMNDPMSANDPSGQVTLPQGFLLNMADLMEQRLDMYYYNQSQVTFGTAISEFTIFDTVVGGAGAYTYTGDTWDQMMQDGYGGGVVDDPNNSLMCGGVVCGYTWPFLAGMVLNTSPMPSGTVSVEESVAAPQIQQQPRVKTTLYGLSCGGSLTALGIGAIATGAAIAGLIYAPELEPEIYEGLEGLLTVQHLSIPTLAPLSAVAIGAKASWHNCHP